MSWIVGIIGDSIPGSEQEAILSRFHHCNNTIQIPGKFLAVSGGNTKTLFSYTDNAISYVVAGVGLHRSASFTSILTAQDWMQRLKQEPPTLDDIEGHFVVIRYKENTLECFSDRVGLRTMYFAQTSYGWTFSTQLHQVCSLLPSSSIDWKTFGSRWLGLQQFSHNSPITGIYKVPPNGYARIYDNRFSLSGKPWISFPELHVTPEQIVEILRKLLSLPDKKILLGLSGGLDSRILLAIISSLSRYYETYSFGRSDDADVALAERICRNEQIPFQKISEENLPADQCIELMHNYLHKTNLVEGAATSVRLRFYSQLDIGDSVMIDGGNGEILRRQFLQRIVVRRKNDMLHCRTEKLFPYFLLQRADIFNDETTSLMKEGALHDLERSFLSIPSPEEIGVENFLDLWTVSTRIPIVACDEQARIDEHVVNFMPFSQPSIIQNALSVSLFFRNNNRLSKKLIRSFHPSLSRYPLVKNGISYPYGLTTLQSRIWTKARSVIGKRDSTAHVQHFLNAIKEFTLDTVHAVETKNYSHYDYDKILHIVTAYYNGDRRYASQVNWWLAFDVWRKAVEKKADK